MSSSISYEYLQIIKAAPEGLATLGADGKVPVAQLPDSAIETYKGEFATSQELTTQYPTAKIADYAYITASSSFWYWNHQLATPAWVNQETTALAYSALTAAQKAAVPYIIIS